MGLTSKSLGSGPSSIIPSFSRFEKPSPRSGDCEMKEAVLGFLQGTRVRCMVVIGPRGEEGRIAK